MSQSKYAQPIMASTSSTTRVSNPHAHAPASHPNTLAGANHNGTPFFETFTSPVQAGSGASRTGAEAVAARGQGRIELREGEQHASYPLNTTSNVAGGVEGGSDSIASLSIIQQPTALSQAYFSAANMTIIQNALRKRVFDATGTAVCEQDTEQLQIVMRSIFLTYSRNDTSSADAIRSQIAGMNYKVLEYCAPVVISNLKQHQQYLVDITTGPTYMEHAISTTDSKTLEHRPFI